MSHTSIDAKFVTPISSERENTINKRNNTMLTDVAACKSLKASQDEGTSCRNNYWFSIITKKIARVQKIAVLLSRIKAICDVPRTK